MEGGDLLEVALVLLHGFPWKGRFVTTRALACVVSEETLHATRPQANVVQQHCVRVRF